MKRAVLYIFRGYPATGKSYLARRLGKALQVPVIVRDEFKTALLSKKIPLNHVGSKSYELMWDAAVGLLKRRRSCICDTSLIQPTGVKTMKMINRKLANICIIECLCSDRALHYRRISSRKNFPDHYGINTIKKLKEFEVKNKQWKNYVFPFPTVRIDTARRIYIKALIKKIEQANNV